MAGNNKTIQEFTVTTGSTVTLDITKPTDTYVFKGSSTISAGNYAVATSATPDENALFTIRWEANITYASSNVVIIFGNTITQEMAAKHWTAIARYNGADYDVHFFIDYQYEGNVYEGIETIAINTAGTTVNLDSRANRTHQRITGNGTLTGNIVINGLTSGPSPGDYFVVEYNATLTVSTFSVQIFNQTLTAAQALSGNISVYGYFTGSVWRGILIPSALYSGTVTNSILANMPALTIKGNATNASAAPQDLTINQVLDILGPSSLQVSGSSYLTVAGPDTVTPTNEYIYYYVHSYRTSTPFGVVSIRLYADGVATTGSPTELLFAASSFATTELSAIAIGGLQVGEIMPGICYMYDGSTIEPLLMTYTGNQTNYSITRFDGSAFPASIDYIVANFDLGFSL